MQNITCPVPIGCVLCHKMIPKGSSATFIYKIGTICNACPTPHERAALERLLRIHQESTAISNVLRQTTIDILDILDTLTARGVDITALLDSIRGSNSTGSA